MIDMTKVIVPKSDQINADDLVGGNMVVTVANVTLKPGHEQPCEIALVETPRFFRPCQSMRIGLVEAWGKDAKQYIGRKIKLYRDSKARYGGQEVGGVRISELSHIERPVTFMITVSRGKRVPCTFMPLADAVTESAPETVDVDAVLARMKQAAQGGTEAVTAEFRKLNKAEKLAIQPEVEKLKALAKKFDSVTEAPQEPESPVETPGTEKPPGDMF